MDLFTLIARLTLDRSQYQQGIAEAEGEGRGFASRLAGGLGTAAKVGGAAIAAVGKAAAAMGTAVVKNTGEVAAYGDAIDKASQKLGISAEAYQEWDAVLQHSGTSIDAMNVGMKTLANAAASGSKSLEALGISAEQAASMSREDLFAQTITALQNVEDANQRAQLAQDLFGRSAMQLGPLLNTSAEDTQAMRDRVHELGGVMSNEAVKASAAYQDSLQDMTTAIDGAKRNLVSNFLPGITTVMDGLTALFTGGDGIGKISDGVSSIIDNISGMLPRVMETGTRIVMALGDAIVANLPRIVDAASQTVMSLVDGIVKQLPEIVRAGLQILVSLARSISDNLPSLVPTIVDVVLEIVDVLTEPDTLSSLIDGAIAIIMALAEGLIRALPRLIAKIPEIIMNILQAIIENAPRLLAAGVELIAQLAAGIVQGIGAAVAAIGQLGADILAGVGGIIDGAIGWGRDLVGNFRDGISNAWDKAKGVVSGLVDGVKGIFGGGMAEVEGETEDKMNGVQQAFDKTMSVVSDTVEEKLDNIKTAYEENGGGIQGVVSAGWEAIEGYYTTGFDVIDKLTDGELSEIKDAFTTAFNTLKDNAINWGKDLISNFIDGIKSMWDKAKGAISKFAGMIKSFLGFSEPEEGPLSNFHTYAPDMVALFAKGIEDSRGLIADAISNTFSMPAPATQAEGMATAQPAYAAAPAAAAPRTLNVQLYIGDTEIARTLVPLLDTERQRVGLSLTKSRGGR